MYICKIAFQARQNRMSASEGEVEVTGRHKTKPNGKLNGSVWPFKFSYDSNLI